MQQRRPDRIAPDDFTLPPVIPRKNPTAREVEWSKFTSLVAVNPHLPHCLAAEARQKLQESGGKKVGLRVCWENLRWDVTIDVIRVEGPYALNDHWTPYFARLLDARCPDLHGKFDLRKAPWADAWAERVLSDGGGAR